MYDPGDEQEHVDHQKEVVVKQEQPIVPTIERVNPEYD